MRPRVTEPQLMLLVILFAVFAFVMQGREHGEELYKAECRSMKTTEDGRGLILPGCFINGVPITENENKKEFAEDLAYALNRAHEERTRKVYGITLTPHAKTISVDPFTFYDCKDGVKATPCTEEKPR